MASHTIPTSILHTLTQSTKQENKNTLYYTIKKYILYIIIFLLLGEIVHQSVKYYIRQIKVSNTATINNADSSNINNSVTSSNTKNINTRVNSRDYEGFKNYNELPYLSDLSKSEPRYVNTDTYNPDTALEPIIIETKIPILSTGNLPVLGYYYDTNYANNVTVSVIKKYILPVTISSYSTSSDVINAIKSNIINLGIIRDYNILSLDNLDTQDKLGNIEVISPLLYETVFMITTSSIKITHFQLINLQDKPINIYTNPNDIELLNIIIDVLKIERGLLRIYVINDMAKCISEFILDNGGILFICCHFKNKYLQSLCDNIKCCVLDYIPTLDTLRAVGNYSKAKPINMDALIKIRDTMLKELYKSVYVISGYDHNLSRNNMISLSKSMIYSTLNIRNSLYINTRNFTEYQLVLLSQNMVKYYQTLSANLNEWNNKQELNNEDVSSFDFLNLANVNYKLPIELNIKNELKKLNLIKIV